MFKTKREKAMANFVKAYREYSEAMKQLRLETGWDFELKQCITSKPDSEAERNELVKKLNAIELEYNTK